MNYTGVISPRNAHPHRIGGFSKLTILIAVAAVAVGAAFLFVSVYRGREEALPPPPPSVSASGKTFAFLNPKKAPHYESNTPAHGVILPGVPPNVVLDVNFDLVAPSSVTITNDADQKDYGRGETVIDLNQLAMRRRMEPEAPNGRYTVTYRACWPDRSCHDGSFQFAIDRAAGESFADFRGKDGVEIKMSDIAFSPMQVRINRGTTVTWVNADPVEHYVNTDAHPAHTFYLAQNSRVLDTGDTYPFRFEEPGAYPYHCSAHASVMTGTILVE